MYMLGAAALFLLFTVGSQSAREGAMAGLRLLGELLIPSLLPYFTAAGLLNRLGFTHAVGRRLSGTLGRLFGISGCGCTVFLLGLSGGYPLGAASAADLYRSGQLDKEEAHRLLRFCDNTGPSFAVGAVGAAFGSTRAGLFLWGTHVLSAMLLGMVFARRQADTSQHSISPAAESFAAAFTGAVQGAVQALLSIGGFVIFFNALLAVLDAAGLLTGTAKALSTITGLEPRWWMGLLTGTLELSSAVSRLQGLPCTGANLALGAFLLSWGGLCIHFQSTVVLHSAGLHTKERLGGKLLQGVLASVLTFLLTPFFF